MSRPSSVKNDSTYAAAVYIVGPSSTGKTTLCKALAKLFELRNDAYIAEVARTVMRTQGFTRDDVARLEMQRAIMDAQVEQEEKGRKAVQNSGGGIMLSDRSAIDAVVYAMLTSVNDEEAARRWQIMVDSESLRRALPAYKRSTFFLLGPVPEWLVDDGIRSLDDQIACLAVFRQTLAKLGIHYWEIGQERKELAERIQEVLRILKIDKGKL